MDFNQLKYVLKTLFLFLLISFLLDKVVFIVLNKISDEVYSGQGIGKLNHYLQIKDNLDMIVFGSSRSNHSIDPTLLNENGFNMGVDGTKIAYSSTLIELLPQQKKQVVLLHIELNQFYDAGYEGDDVQSLNIKYNRDSIIKNQIVKFNQNNPFQEFYWSLGYNRKVLGIIKNYFKPNYDYKKYSGYDPIYVTPNQASIFENILAQVTKEECDAPLFVNAIYNSVLDDLKLFCERNNKILILFTAPELGNQCKDDNVHIAEFMKSKGLTYLDYSDFFKDDYSLAYWKDRTHLSHMGAEIFTKEFKNQLVQLLIAK